MHKSRMPVSQSVGTFIANNYITLTNAAVSGAVLSLTATTTLTVSAVRLPSAGILAISGAVYNTPVSLGSAASFVVRRCRCP